MGWESDALAEAALAEAALAESDALAEAAPSGKRRRAESGAGRKAARPWKAVR